MNIPDPAADTTLFLVNLGTPDEPTAPAVSRFLREQRLNVREALELDELEAIVRLVENGMGVALVPRAGLWLQRPTRLRVIELGELTFHRELVALVRRAQRQPALDCLLSCLLSREASG